MVCDTLEKALPNVRIIRGGICLPVVQRVAAIRSAAVRDARPVVLIIGVADGELIVERMIDSEKPRPHVDFVVVVRTPAKTVYGQSIAVRRRDNRRHECAERTQQRVIGRDDVPRIRIANRHSVN